MIELDRRLLEDYWFNVLMLMENAGRALARFVQRIARRMRTRELAVLAGPGNNGGGGLVAARHLLNWAYDVTVVLTHPTNQLKDAPRRQLQILQQAGVRVILPQEYTGSFPLVVDALLGYRAVGDPQPPISDLIRRTLRARARVVALDLPSGLDATTGHLGAPTMRASWTLTLALPKRGLRTRASRAFVGELWLGDIGVPRSLYQQYGVDSADLFTDADMVRLG